MKAQYFLFSFLFLFIISCNDTKDETKPEAQESQETSINNAVMSVDSNGVFFANLKDGEMVKSPLIVDMGIKGMEVEPAGELHEGKGHHHLIIDGRFEPEGTMVPKDETHIHFGAGQTKDTIDLAPGKHTLTMQFANGMHQSYGEKWSKTISVEVEK